MLADNFARLAARTIAIALLATTLAAQSSSPRAQQVAPPVLPQGATLEPATVDLARPLLPQDTGRTGLDQLLRKLKTTARLMHVVAHPDDEDGGMLTLQARGKGATTMLFTLTRGEGGQNKTGSNLFDELGVLRTLELLESDRYYGVEQRFSRAADFGFSKSSQETLQKWAQQDVNGAMPPDEHNPALADLVRAIRMFRPDVLTTRFQGSPRDRHGHHQAAGILTREAFKAAGDPKRFPDQIAEGLRPWQPLKLYTGARDGDNVTVALNTGAEDAALGTSYIEFAMRGLRHQLSQGAADWSVSPGPHWTRYQLSGKVPGLNTQSEEQDFFAAIDTSLPALFRRLDASDQQTMPWLKDALSDIAAKVDAAANEKDMARAAKPLLTAATQMDMALQVIEAARVSPAAKEFLGTHLGEKRQQLFEAANLALGITMEARVGRPDTPTPPEREAQFQVSPGDKVFVVVRLHNGSKLPIEVSNMELNVPRSWIAKSYVGENRIVQPGEDLYANFAVVIGENAKFTRPIYTRRNPETDTVWDVAPGAPLTRPLPPLPITAAASYSLYKPPSDWTFRLFGAAAGAASDKKRDLPGASIAAPLVVAYTDAKSEEKTRPRAIAPAFSVLMEPASQVMPASSTEPRSVTVNVSTIERQPTSGEVTLQAPERWVVEPARHALSFDNAHREHDVTFTVTPSNHDPGKHELRATFSSGGRSYSEGYSTVTRDDLGAFYYYQPAVQKISVVDVKVPTNLKVGYIMGAGDDIPTVLRQLGLNVQLLTPEQVASADLSRYDTIVLGIRAYDTREDVRKHNSRLLEYVRNGGTLIVQYNADWTEFNSGNFMPYPATLSRDRVTVESAPVEILAANDSVFQVPNRITERDFDAWVQERGLYFMSDFDKQYTPLLSSNDPGEPARRGGLLRANYGKGTYIYTGYAFFRQLPNGVPGAIRLFVNLISAGHARP